MNHAFPIRNESDYHRALALIDALWDCEPASPEAELLDVMATLTDLYERQRRDLPAADPRKLVAFKLRELGWSQRELGRRLGWGTGRVSEVLAGRRPLTLRMVRELAAVLELPAGLLVEDGRNDDGEHVWVRLPRDTAERLARLAEGDSPVVDMTVELPNGKFERVYRRTSTQLEG